MGVVKAKRLPPTLSNVVVGVQVLVPFLGKRRATPIADLTGLWSGESETDLFLIQLYILIVSQNRKVSLVYRFDGFWEIEYNSTKLIY